MALTATVAALGWIQMCYYYCRRHRTSGQEISLKREEVIIRATVKEK